ncbi:hypothetical protein [Nocardiopsis tropica]|jgi:hypothetical protein|uniref:Uncharacterized protein n=1 Tax=Nocardiopsis tropica TaxID=109330 RepID=A0ABU7KUX9_9ACTN|nr:hypothetical protein [Nocardiopsis umidischolae]MEE2053106.1 hypothetical protein [Nocardiopsis umidischolae]
MTESQDIQAQAREALLKKIVELAPVSEEAEDVKDLAEAYALIVSIDEEHAGH